VKARCQSPAHARRFFIGEVGIGGKRPHGLINLAKPPMRRPATLDRPAALCALRDHLYFSVGYAGNVLRRPFALSTAPAPSPGTPREGECMAAITSFPVQGKFRRYEDRKCWRNGK